MSSEILKRRDEDDWDDSHTNFDDYKPNSEQPVTQYIGAAFQRARGGTERNGGKDWGAATVALVVAVIFLLPAPTLLNHFRADGRWWPLACADILLVAWMIAISLSALWPTGRAARSGPIFSTGLHAAILWIPVSWGIPAALHHCLLWIVIGPLVLIAILASLVTFFAIPDLFGNESITRTGRLWRRDQEMVWQRESTPYIKRKEEGNEHPDV